MISSIIQAVGILTISVGVSLIYLPAGLITLGVGVLLFGLARGTDKK